MNSRKDFRGPHGTRLYETVGLRDGKSETFTTSSTLTFCCFGYMKLSIEKDVVEVR